MFQKRTESYDAQRRALEQPEHHAPQEPKMISDMELFALGGGTYRQVKVNGN